jgi:PAS domain S-box-containing protein
MSFVTIFRSIFIFLCFLFSLLGYITYLLNISIDKKDDALKHQAELRVLGDLLAKGSDYLTAEVRSYVQFGNKLHYDNFWREVNKTRSRDKVVEKLKNLKVLPRNLKYIEIAKEYSDNLIKIEKKAMDEVQAGNYRAARELVFGEYYVDQKKLIMGNINNFQTLINKKAFEETKIVESDFQLLIKITNSLLILLGLLVLFFFYFIGIKQLVEPLKILTNLMLELAQGNLGVNIPRFARNNEIVDMSSALEVFKDNFIKRFEKERLLNTVVNNTASIIYVKDLEGRYLFTNKRWRELLNLQTNEVLGKNDHDLFPKELAIKFNQIDSEVIKSGLSFKGEEVIPHDDKLCFYITTKVPLLDSMGKVYGLCGISTDITKVKAAEKGIEKERKNLFNMLDQLPACFHLQASDYSIPFANKMFRDRFGDIEGNKCYKAMHERKIVCDPCPTFKTFDSYKTESSVWSSQDGKTYMSVVTPFDDSSGETLLMEMSIDITREQQSRKSQLQSESRFRTIFNESPLGVALIDSLTGKIFEVNVRFAEIAGRSLAEMRTIDWMSITHPDDVQEDLDNMTALNSGEISGFNMEKRYVKPDGCHVWINMTISPLTVEDKTKPLHLCMIEDITEKKNSEKDITRFGRVLSSSSNEIYMFNSLTLKFIQVNSGACENLGYSMEELSKLTPLDLKPNINLETFEEMIKPLRQQKEVKVVFETVHKRKDESSYPVNVNLQLIHEESPPLFVAIIEDITTRKKVERELKRYQNNLEGEINRRTLELKSSQAQLIQSEKLSTLGSFVGTIAHEFNNPLFGVINLVDQLGEKKLKDEDRKRYSDIAQKECWRMAQMIKNLQSFYKPSEGIFICSEIDEMIGDILLIVAKACEIKRIQIKKIYNTDIFSFEVIEDQITQVMLNILQNSIDSISEDGGKITLTIDRTNSDLILKVQDTGEGIKEENLKLIFDPFFTTKGKEGTGLGLSISYGIIKSHGGNIKVESTLGVGTTVIITLPVSRVI